MIDTSFLELLPDPIDTVLELDNYIVGQEDAKKHLSIMMLNHVLNLIMKNNPESFKGIKIEKSNVLMIGPTGCGKTSMLIALEKIFNFPITRVDCSNITSGGYIGGKVEDILVQHISNVQKWISSADYNDYNKELKTQSLTKYSTDSPYQERFSNSTSLIKQISENGIIYIDEIDKICKKGSSNDRDVKGDMVQIELLKILDGYEVDLNSSRIRHKCSIDSIKTDNIFFICGGAFSGLEEIIKKRVQQKQIGFVSEISKKVSIDHWLSKVSVEDLIEYGFRPEFLGRLPLITTLTSLSKQDIFKIIDGVENSFFKQYFDFFKIFGVNFIIEENAKDIIAEHVLKLGTGARGLKQIFFKLLKDDIFNILYNNNKEIKLTEKSVKKVLLK